MLTKRLCAPQQVRIEQAENRLDLAMVADLKYGALQEVDEQIRRCVDGMLTLQISETLIPACAWRNGPRVSGLKRFELQSEC